MKALILAAGFGTRLLPHTRTVPKPLFPIAGRTLLDIHIEALSDAGCEAVMVNTHHRAREIERHISTHRYPIPVHTRFEPRILGTGGAVKNVETFFDARPFMVINADIHTTIDPGWVYRYHLSHADPVTLVLFDDPEFNTVAIGPDGAVRGFRTEDVAGSVRYRTFTGIQVLDPEIFGYLPPGAFSSIIDAYGRMMADGKTIRGLVSQGSAWSDVGSPRRYIDRVFQTIAPRAYRAAFPDAPPGPICRRALGGDGSDRSWYRLLSGTRSMIMVEHGIQETPEWGEFDAFLAIGGHLYARGVPVPRIFLSDRFSGQVFVEDLGDTHLQTVILQTPDATAVADHYRRVIALLIRMNRQGAEGFDPGWTYQTPVYDPALVLDRECRYFIDAFVNGYLGMSVDFQPLEAEFVHLAQRACTTGPMGFMHRDFQSRNILVKDHRYYVIDFQGGRTGPLQYDLAALLVDPYVALPQPLRDDLAAFGARTVADAWGIDAAGFLSGYRYCTVTRSLQILGAFGFLTTVKKKRYFKRYIPAALESLKTAVRGSEFPRLARLVERIELKVKD